MYRGRIPQVYQTLADALKPYSKEGLSILEIGCASGYYFEILEYLLSHKFAYEGVDYSSALIRMAKNLYPLTPFHVADGARLPFVNNHFPVVISSCILLHVPNFRDHIRETARVAGKVVIAHRTPVCRNRPTQYIKKFAYSVETVELLFNEAEILSVFKSHGLIKVNAIELDGSVREDNFCITYVFEKTTSGNSSSEYSSSEKENDFITLIAQGEAAFSSGNFELSHKLLHRAALLNPESSRLLCDLGVLSCQAGDLEGGLILMQRACTNDQHNRKSLVNLVEILDTLMRSREAWPWLDRYLELHPTDTEIRSLRNA
jgi:protein-L-isoaspartate O-methyltransferase